MQQDEVNMEILKLEFADFDRELGAFLLRFAAFDIPEISLAGMLTAYELRSGNPQLDLAAYAGKTIEMSPGEYVIRVIVKDIYDKSQVHPLMRNFYDIQHYEIAFTVS